MRALWAIGVLAAAGALGACDDERGLPDLSAPPDRRVGATLQVDDDGCGSRPASVRVGDTVVVTAAADDVEAATDERRWYTGRMRRGESVDWVMADPGRFSVTCHGSRAASTIELDVAPSP